MLPCVTRLALAPERARCIQTGAPILAQTRQPTFIHITPTVAALIAGWARTVVSAIPVGTAAAIKAWLAGTGIKQRAVLASEAFGAGTLVVYRAVS